jgi:hypothetical protein
MISHWAAVAAFFSRAGNACDLRDRVTVNSVKHLESVFAVTVTQPVPALCRRSVWRLATCTAFLSDVSVFEH